MLNAPKNIPLVLLEPHSVIVISAVSLLASVVSSNPKKLTVLLILVYLSVFVVVFNVPPVCVRTSFCPVGCTTRLEAVP